MPVWVSIKWSHQLVLLPVDSNQHTTNMKVKKTIKINPCVQCLKSLFLIDSWKIFSGLYCSCSDRCSSSWQCSQIRICTCTSLCSCTSLWTCTSLCSSTSLWSCCSCLCWWGTSLCLQLWCCWWLLWSYLQPWWEQGWIYHLWILLCCSTWWQNPDCQLQGSWCL